tara:strand:- start:150 stop:377 length:228 start_codon:yes stop_codon:yes gene_type:complete
MHYINRKDNDMTSAIKDQLALDNSNNESKMVPSNKELRDKALFQIEQFELMLASHKIEEAVAHLREAKEFLKQIS